MKFLLTISACMAIMMLSACASSSSFASHMERPVDKQIPPVVITINEPNLSHYMGSQVPVKNTAAKLTGQNLAQSVACVYAVDNKTAFASMPQTAATSYMLQNFYTDIWRFVVDRDSTEETLRQAVVNYKSERAALSTDAAKSAFADDFGYCVETIGAVLKADPSLASWIL